MDHRCTPLVSVQRTAAGTALDRHVSWGALVAPDLVVAPAPEKDLADPDHRFEVVVLAPGRGCGRDPERIGVSRVEVLRLEGVRDGVVVLVLDRPSRHPVSAPTTGAEDVRSASTRGVCSLWEILEALGLVPHGVLGRPLSLLKAVVAWERRHVAETTVAYALASTDSLSDFLCCTWHVCTCKKSARRRLGAPVPLATPVRRR